MNVGSLLLDGLVAMALGMLWVFAFLTIMIFCMKLMSKALAPISTFLEPVAPAPKKKKNPAAAKGAISPEDRVRALAAIEAVKLFRSGAKSK